MIEMAMVGLMAVGGVLAIPRPKRTKAANPESDLDVAALSERLKNARPVKMARKVIADAEAEAAKHNAKISKILSTSDPTIARNNVNVTTRMPERIRNMNLRGEAMLQVAERAAFEAERAGINADLEQKRRAVEAAWQVFTAKMSDLGQSERSVAALKPYGVPMQTSTAVEEHASGISLEAWRARTWPKRATRPQQIVVDLED